MNCDMSGLYIHVPFCNSKCVYCGFYSTVNQKDVDLYLEYLIHEMDLHIRGGFNWDIQTIYFGGGTPSLLKPAQLKCVLSEIRSRFHIADNAEITIEANPEQLDLDCCGNLKTLGFNRLSVGIQSFDDNILHFLGRRHTSADALKAVENAKVAGFDNISVDLIYGVNERSNAMWRKELDTLLSLPVRHFSAYSLTVEENSLLYRRIKQHRDVEPDENMASEQYAILCDVINRSRFQQYEVSNFAEPGCESKHNSAYWNGTPYLGLGPSAHSFDGRKRWWNAPTLNAYYKQIDSGFFCHDSEKLSDDDCFNEYVLLRLRTFEGIDLHEMERNFGADRVGELLKYFEDGVDRGCYELSNSRLHLTSQGFWFADGIAAGAFV